MSNTIKVTIISKDGKIVAREINKHGKEPIEPHFHADVKKKHDYIFNHKRWKLAESNLKEYEIEKKICCEVNLNGGCFNKACPMLLKIGSIHSAEIINSNTVRIID